jgi:uncharacterized protein YlxP (DUF503 family)
MDLNIPLAQSLKSKWIVLKSLKDRIGAGDNVTVAALDEQGKWQRCLLGDKAHIDSSL